MARRRKKGFGSSAEEHQREAIIEHREMVHALSQGEALVHKGHCAVALGRFSDAARHLGALQAELHSAGTITRVNVVDSLHDLEKKIREKCFGKGGR